MSDPLTTRGFRRYRRRAAGLVVGGLGGMLAGALALATLPEELAGLALWLGIAVAPVMLIFGAAGLLQAARMKRTLTSNCWRHRFGHYRQGTLGPSLVIDADEYGPEAVSLIRATKFRLKLLDDGDGPILVAGDPSDRSVVAALDQRGLLLTRRPILGWSLRRTRRDAMTSGEPEPASPVVKGRLVRCPLVVFGLGSVSLALGVLSNTKALVLISIPLLMMAGFTSVIMQMVTPAAVARGSERDHAQGRPWRRYLQSPAGTAAISIYAAGVFLMISIVLTARRNAAAPLAVLGTLLVCAGLLARKIADSDDLSSAADRRAGRLVISFMLLTVGLLAMIGAAVGLFRPSTSRVG